MFRVSGRLIVAIVSTALEELALAALMLWWLPYLGIFVTLPVFATVLVIWAVFAVFLYWKGSGALRQEPLIGFTSMVGSQGKAITCIDKDGLVKIDGEIWSARSRQGKIEPGELVVVVGQYKLTLDVAKAGSLNNH